MNWYDDAKRQLKSAPRNWAISGVAGFIGSNLLAIFASEASIRRVTGLDNIATGQELNLDEVKRLVEPAQGHGFDFTDGDVCAIGECHACARARTMCYIRRRLA